MRQTINFLIGLILSLAILTGVTAVIVQRTTRRWFENDERLRAELVVSGAREALSAHWSDNDQSELQRILEQITRHDPIMAAAACTTNLTLLTSTTGFPPQISCVDIGVHVRHSDGEMAENWSRWDESTTLPGRSIFVSAIPVENEDQDLGFVILIHDLSYAEQRETRTTRFVLLRMDFLLS